jgi:hypothetical protein
LTSRRFITQGSSLASSIHAEWLIPLHSHKLPFLSQDQIEGSVFTGRTDRLQEMEGSLGIDGGHWKDPSLDITYF